MWKNQRTTPDEERTETMDVANPGSPPRTVLLDVEPGDRESRHTAVQRHDLFARILGLVICLAGVAIIGLVIYFAYEMYRDPNLGKLPNVPAGQTGVPISDVGSIFTKLIIQIGLLALMSISGSLIANKGI